MSVESTAGHSLTGLWPVSSLGVGGVESGLITG